MCGCGRVTEDGSGGEDEEGEWACCTDESGGGGDDDDDERASSSVLGSVSQELRGEITGKVVLPVVL